jgi:hypothetical protein
LPTAAPPPQAKLVAVLINSDWPAAVGFQTDVEEAARAVGLPIQILRANNESEIDDAFDGLAQSQAGALLVGPGPFFDSRRDKLIALAAKAGVPAGYESRATAIAGGLVSYGTSVQDGYRQVEGQKNEDTHNDKEDGLSSGHSLSPHDAVSVKPTIQHPKPTRAMADGAVPADNPQSGEA